MKCIEQGIISQGNVSDRKMSYREPLDGEMYINHLPQHQLNTVKNVSLISP